METDEQPFNDNRYVFLLKITSEEDLLVTDEATGEKKYTPVTKDDVDQFKREAEHLSKEIRHAMEDFQWKTEKRKDLTHYNHIYQNLAEQLTDFLEYIHTLHKKVYISIYKSYDDELMAIYKEVLEKVLNDIQDIAHKHVNYFLDVDDYGQFLSDNAIYAQYEKLTAQTSAEFPHFIANLKVFISTGLKLALEKTIATITRIYNDFNDLCRTRFSRTDQEAVIIYHYIKRDFDEHMLPAHLEHEAKVQKRHMESRRMGFTKVDLQKVMVETIDKYGNYKLCGDWYNNINEEDEEELVHTLVREQASPEDFVKLFKYQGEYGKLEEKIAQADDYEHHGDSLFANWVDPYKLENMLKFWIKGNMTKQQNWYIVWCLMKYTFHMVRDNQDKAAFAARMNLMFPDVEKKCVVDSFRKQETQKNHNRHFSEWLADSDPDYHTAQDLYNKLKKMEDYKRSI
mgnify:FL=1